MCVLAFAWHAHPRWQLVVAGNRDELHGRPTEALAPWLHPKHLLAGRDLQSGGTWLGVSEEGRFAVVTNLSGFGISEPHKASRGALVSDFLAGQADGAELEVERTTLFNPFNLILADRFQARFISNRPEPISRVLVPGIYGLSNGQVDEPWPKTVKLQANLRHWLAAAAGEPKLLLEDLAEGSSGAEAASDAPEDSGGEARLSSVFVRNRIYGTRCSTVVAIEENGAGIIIERRFSADGEAVGDTELPFTWTN